MSRLSHMLVNEQTRRGHTDREASEEIGALQQTFGAWKKGSVPRSNKRTAIAAYLGISADAMAELVEEQPTDGAPSLSAYRSAQIYGRIADRKEGRYRFNAFNQGRKRVPEGRYVIAIDTKVMEPALHVGTKAWLDPEFWPTPGDEVMVHTAGGHGWLGRLVSLGERAAEIESDAGRRTLENVVAVHVIVLSERVARSRA